MKNKGFCHILGFKDRYSVARDGRIYSHKTKRFLRHYINGCGYPTVSLVKPGLVLSKVLVHRIVARAFLGECPKDKQVDHKNRDRGDTRLSNLRYVSRGINGHNTLKRPMRNPKTFSRFKGVIFRLHRSSALCPWVASARFQRKRYYTKYFSSPEEAAMAYDRLVLGLYGASATTNKSLGYL